jgi:hypothetical protein
LSRDGGGGNAWTAMRRGGAARFFHRESLGLGDRRGGAVWTQEVESGHPVERQRIESDGFVILDSQTIEIFSPGNKLMRRADPGKLKGSLRDLGFPNEP